MPINVDKIKLLISIDFYNNYGFYGVKFFSGLAIKNRLVVNNRHVKAEV